MTSPKIVGIDFDGTCVEHMYPRIGADVPHAERVIRRLQKAGHRLVLWTMRDHRRHADATWESTLDDAIRWFSARGISLEGVNCNAPGADFSKSRKVYCNVYIDDAALGCPLVPGAHGDRLMVDWIIVEQMLEEQGYLVVDPLR